MRIVMRIKQQSQYYLHRLITSLIPDPNDHNQ
jgi:hypothetical protein